MEPDELLIFRDEFAKIDISDDSRLRKWFQDYPELSDIERCQIARRSRVTIYRWRKRLGITKILLVETMNGAILYRRKNKMPEPRRVIDKNIVIPDDWEYEAEWLDHCYNVLYMSERELSRVLGVSRHRVKRALSRHNLARRSQEQAMRAYE